MERMSDRDLKIVVANCLAEGNMEKLRRAIDEMERRGLLTTDRTDEREPVAT